MQMRKLFDPRRLFCIFIAAILILCTAALPAAATSQPPSSDEDAGEPIATIAETAASNELLISFKRTVDKNRKNDILTGESLEVTGEIPQINTVVVKLPPGASAAQMQSLVVKYSGYIDAVEPNYLVSASLVPNDEHYLRKQPNLTTMNVEKAWDHSTGADTMVAVLDSGVTFTHPDMVGRFTDNGYDFVNNDSDPTDDNGHGTMVSGLVGATGNNAKGIAGVNWDVRIMPVKVLNDRGTGTHDVIAKGIIHATDNGAKIINMSFGSATDTATLRRAVDYAYGHGVILVASSGNDYKGSVCYPARNERVIAVGSGGPTGKLSYSNYGPGLNTLALGNQFSTARNGDYANCAGTSFSSPIVAGALSLALGVYPEMTVDDAIQLVADSSIDLGRAGYDETTGWGLLDPEQVMVNAELLKEQNSEPVAPTPEEPADPSPSPSPAPSEEPPVGQSEIRVFTGRIGDKNSGQALAHKFLFNNTGKLEATATWTGRGQARMLILDKNENLLASTELSSNTVSLTYDIEPADEYWIVMQAKDLRATVKYTVNASVPYLTSDLGQEEIALADYPVPLPDSNYMWFVVLAAALICLVLGFLAGRRYGRPRG